MEEGGTLAAQLMAAVNASLGVYNYDNAIFLAERLIAEGAYNIDTALFKMSYFTYI